MGVLEALWEPLSLKEPGSYKQCPHSLWAHLSPL